MDEQKAAFTRVPPHSQEAEESVIGAMLTDSEAFDRIADLVTATDFYVERHARIFAAITTLQTQARPADVITVTEALRQSGELQRIGGTAYLVELAERVVTAANVEHYARIVHDKSVLRRLIRTSTEILGGAYESRGSTRDFLDKAETAIFEISSEITGNALKRIDTLISSTVERIEMLFERKSDVTGVATGYYDLDRMTAGLQPSDLIIVAGRPSMGKCLTADSEIMLADGSIRTIEEIVQARAGKLLTLNDEWRFEAAEPSAFVDDGIKPVFEVTTRLGRRVRTTLSHPFLTLGGWKPLGELEPGAPIAVPRKLSSEGARSIGTNQARHLGYLVGGESPRQPSVLSSSCEPGGVTGTRNLDEPVDRDVNAATGTYGASAQRGGSLQVDTSPWLESFGLEFATEKFVPELVFQLVPEEIAAFLSGLFSVSGRIVVLPNGRPRLDYRMTSERVARQAQHLLLRHGVVARLLSRELSDADTKHKAWQVEIGDDDAIAGFVQKIVAPCDETAVERFRFLLSRLVEFPERQPADVGDVYWDQIVSIEPVGMAQVYDLTIDGTHNFVANDICVHNTAFCLNIAEYAAGECNVGVGLFSMEMSSDQLVMRMLCSQAEIDNARVRTGNLRDRDIKNIALTAGKLGGAPIYIDDTPAQTVLEIRAKARRLKHDAAAGLGLIIIDYLQLMRGAGEDSREQEISAISRSLKALAKELNVPIIALSQLNRQVELRSDKRPGMADLRESGALEQDADVIVFLYRDEQYNSDTAEPGVAEIIVGKQRNGPTGTVRLMFDKAFARFRNFSSREDAPHPANFGGGSYE